MEIKSSLVNHKEFKFTKNSLIEMSEIDGKENFRVHLLEYINDTSDNDDDEFFYDMLTAVRFLNPSSEAVAYTDPYHLIYMNAPAGGNIGESMPLWDFVYDHECLHQLWDTFGVADRIKKEGIKYNHYILNIASDCVINDYLIYCRKKKMPDGLITPEYLKVNFGVEYNNNKDTQYTLYLKLLERAEELAKDPRCRRICGYGGEEGQNGQGERQNGQGSSNSNESADSAAKRAQNAADNAQQKADEANSNGSKDADEKQKAADEAKAAADEAKEAADKAKEAAKAGDKEEEEKQTKKAREVADKAEQAAGNNGKGNKEGKNNKSQEKSGKKQNSKNTDNSKIDGEGNPNGDGSGTSTKGNIETKEDLEELRKKFEKTIQKYKNKIGGDLGQFIKQCRKSFELNETGLTMKAPKGAPIWAEKLNGFVNSYVQIRVFQKHREYKRTYQRIKRGSGFVKFGEPIQKGKKLKDDKLTISVAFWVDRSASMTGIIENVFDAAYMIADALTKQFSQDKVVGDMQYKMITFDDRIEEIKWGSKVQARGGNMSMHEYLKELENMTGDCLINVFITDGQFEIDKKQVKNLLDKLDGCLIFVTNQGDETMKTLSKDMSNLFYVEAEKDFTIK